MLGFHRYFTEVGGEEPTCVILIPQLRDDLVVFILAHMALVLSPVAHHPHSCTPRDDTLPVYATERHIPVGLPQGLLGIAGRQSLVICP